MKTQIKMSWIKSLFSEEGNVSMMRVLSLVALLTGCGLAIAGKDTSVSVFVTAAFGGKVVQKLIENKIK